MVYVTMFFCFVSRARKLKYVITLNEGVKVEKREVKKLIELREDTYGFGKDDIWHLLTSSRLVFYYISI